MTKEEWLEIPVYIRYSIERLITGSLHDFDFDRFEKKPADQYTFRAMEQCIRQFIFSNFDKLPFDLEERLALRDRLPPYEVKITLNPERFADVRLVFPDA